MFIIMTQDVIIGKDLNIQKNRIKTRIFCGNMCTFV